MPAPPFLFFHRFFPHGYPAAARPGDRDPVLACTHHDPSEKYLSIRRTCPDSSEMLLVAGRTCRPEGTVPRKPPAPRSGGENTGRAMTAMPPATMVPGSPVHTWAWQAQPARKHACISPTPGADTLPERATSSLPGYSLWT